ncbi:MAG: hypothetical protein AVDCRST_MAG49-2895 [uncultured Thermomicrobiales bacterium]|uniref:Uncharacterized protein n=1 Tax=uncultured Thermomicrobiales bacterium TaxID=1645740 RepID=A0A6J4UN45_9BACT|nr:MAG: hypothetical protein AVDCRST_MAG49-2895 [uncultured Thermomicrobiales bacterium]
MTAAGGDDPTAVSARLWVPDNPDGSGWADVDWVSAVRGSRYHYRHGLPLADARAARSPFYAVTTRLESAALSPHENTYYVPGDALADFLAEVALAGGAEVIWHVAPCADPPPDSRVQGPGEPGRVGT